MVCVLFLHSRGLSPGCIPLTSILRSVLFLATSIHSVIDGRQLHDKAAAKEQIVQTAAAREAPQETTQATETV